MLEPTKNEKPDADRSAAGPDAGFSIAAFFDSAAALDVDLFDRQSVNAALLVALQALGLRSALLIACVTPVVAWLQQLLPLPVFILPVALGNSLYIWLFSRLRRAGPEWLAVGSAALGKAAFFFLAFRGLLSMLELPPALSAAILFVMGWPQLVTGLIGGFIAIYAWRRLERI